MSAVEILQTIQERLVSLEKKDVENSEMIQVLQQQSSKLEENIFTLQKENFDLKRDVFNYEKENIKLNEKVEAMETKIAAIELTCQDIPEIKKDVIASVTTRIRRIVDFVTPNIEDFEIRLTKIETDIPILKRAKKRLVSDSKFLKMETANLDTRVLVRDLTRRADAMEDRMRKVSESVTRARISPSGGLRTAQWVKLDKCLERLGTSGLLDPSTCSLVPDSDGVYFIGARFVQGGGEGEIGMWLNWDKSGTHREFLGKTKGGGDANTGLAVVTLEKGQEVWLEARRKEGGAGILYCCLFCWRV